MQKAEAANQYDHQREAFDEHAVIVAGPGKGQNAAKAPDDAERAAADQRRHQGDDDLADHPAAGDEDEVFRRLLHRGS